MVLLELCWWDLAYRTVTPHAAMPGPSAWSVGDRELMAAYVSTVNESAFCVGAQTATARQQRPEVGLDRGWPRRRRSGQAQLDVVLMSLKSLIETGTCAPDPHDVKIDNWN